MTKAQAKQTIKDFLTKYRGKSVLFNTLNDTEKQAYILTNSFNYFNDFLSTNEAIIRAIENTEAHAKNNFEVFKRIC